MENVIAEKDMVEKQTSEKQKNDGNNNAQTSRTVIIAFLAFIGLGLTSGLLGLAWPSMQRDFSLPLDGVNTLFVVQTIAYTLASFTIGRIMARFGSGLVLLAGVVLMVVALFGIALSSTWLVVVAVSAVLGLGTGVLDAGLNMYIAAYHTARQMSWLHACFGIGITFGPLIMTAVLQQKLSWQVGYAIVGVILMIIVVLFAATRNLWRNEGFQSAGSKPVQRAPFSASVRLPVLWMGMATFLAYVGVEIGIGQWAYTLMTEARHIPPEVAGIWVSIYWGTFTLGRIGFGIIANRFQIETLLRWCMVGIIVGTVLFWWNPINAIGFLGLVIVGVAQAPTFPLLMSGTQWRVGTAHSENAVSLQMTAVGIGSAILPGLIGTIGKNFGLEMMALSFVIMSVVVFVCHELTRITRVQNAALSGSAD